MSWIVVLAANRYIDWPRSDDKPCPQPMAASSCLGQHPFHHSCLSPTNRCDFGHENCSDEELLKVYPDIADSFICRASLKTVGDR